MFTLLKINNIWDWISYKCFSPQRIKSTNTGLYTWLTLFIKKIKMLTYEFGKSITLPFGIGLKDTTNGFQVVRLGEGSFDLALYFHGDKPTLGFSRCPAFATYKEQS